MTASRDQRIDNGNSSENTSCKKGPISASSEAAAEQIKALSRLTVKATYRRDFEINWPGRSHCVSDHLYRINGVPVPLAEHLGRLQQMANHNPDINVDGRLV